MLQPGASASFRVVFASPDVGRSEASLRFEAVGGTRDFILPCLATAAVPTINSDPVSLDLHVVIVVIAR